MQIKQKAILTSALTLLLATSGGPVSAADPQETEGFYKGKTLNIIVGLAAGGGYDQYARTLGRHLSRHIPGQPSIVVQNMTGAAGLTSANWLYNIAPRDGLTIGLTQRSVFIEPLYGTKEATFDPRKFSWLASLNDEAFIAATWKGSGLDSIADAQVKSFPVAADGPASDDFVWPAVLNATIGTRFNIISGYKGKAEERLATKRGETAGLVGWSWGALKSSELEDFRKRDWRIIAYLGRGKHPDFAAPSIYDYAKTKEAEEALDFLVGTLVLGRPVIGPPQLPHDREALLRKAIDDTLKDPEFLADADKQNLEISPSPGAEIAQRVEALYRTPPDVVARVQAARKPIGERRADTSRISH